MGALDTIFSAGDVVKRRVKDFARNPLAYLEMVGDQQRRQWRENPEEQALNYFNPEAGLAGLAGVIKPKGGNWLSGSVEDALRGLKRYQPTRAWNPSEPAIAEPLNNWIEGPLTKYVKTRMASPDDEVRKLAEQGVLHFAPDWVPEASMARGEMAAKDIANVGRLGKSRLAQDWEDLTDTSITGAAAKDWKANAKPEVLSRIEGFDRIPESTMIYERSNPGMNQSLGFPHLIDELSNALNPASGLPRNLLLTPEAIQQMSMEKAVRRVADINAWRAAQKIEANRKLAEQASLVREYAENNPKRLRWVELKVGETLPEGYTLRHEAQQNGPGGYRVLDPNGKPIAFGATEQEAVIAANRGPLADQLKYEGDVMGHCVGGYCDDVLEGRTRIFSLRDAKGEPHVTVEVTPERSYGSDHLNAQRSQAEKEALEQGLDPDKMTYHSFIAQRMDELAKQNLPSRITQIKGKQNRKPNDEYLPFVQDFVRNSPLGGQWSDVGDLGNTGLTAVPKESTLARRLAQEGREIPGYMTDAEYKALVTEFGMPEYSRGGSVTASPQDSGYNSSIPSWDIFAEAE